MISIFKNHISNLFLLTLLLIVFSCNDSDKVTTNTNTSNATDSIDKKQTVPPAIILASMNAVAPDSLRKNFKNLITVANCTSPLGKYTTQLNTSSDGYMYFKQVFSYKLDPFEAVLVEDSAFFTLGDSTGILPKPLIFTVRNQALINVVLELPQRFHDFEDVGTIKVQDQIIQKIKAKDIRDYYSALYFDTADKKLSAWEFVNPEKLADTILVKFSNWKNTGGFNLPFHADIIQGGKQLTFNYTRIEINNPQFKKIRLSPKKMSSVSGQKKS